MSTLFLIHPKCLWRSTGNASDLSAVVLSGTQKQNAKAKHAPAAARGNMQPHLNNSLTPFSSTRFSSNDMPLYLEVDENDFEFDEDLLLYKGVPFTGIACNSYPNLKLRRHVIYKDGFKNGPCREWYANGQLKSEWFASRGLKSGKATQWHENGQLKSIAEYEFGIQLCYDEWDDADKLQATRRIDTSSEQFKYLQQLRTKNKPH